MTEKFEYDFEKLFNQPSEQFEEEKKTITIPLPKTNKYGNKTVGRVNAVSGDYWKCRDKFLPSKHNGMDTFQIYRNGEFLIYGKDYTVDKLGNIDVHDKEGEFKFSNIHFGSQAEFSAFEVLWKAFTSKRITSLECQKDYRLTAHDKEMCVYKADFVVTKEDGTVDVIDVKGVVTPLFKLKAKLFEAQYGHEIKIWGAKGDGWTNY